MPMTLIEAMGTGLPIIASNVGGIPDMLTDQKDAVLIEPKEDCVISALELIYFDEEKRKYLGRNARDRSAVFSEKTMAKRYIDVYIDASGEEVL